MIDIYNSPLTINEYRDDEQVDKPPCELNWFDSLFLPLGDNWTEKVRSLGGGEMSPARVRLDLIVSAWYLSPY